MAYQQAPMSFRHEVNCKFPPKTSANNTRTRSVNEVTGGGRPIRYNMRTNARFCSTSGRGRRLHLMGGRTERGVGRGHPNASFITRIDARTIKAH